MLFLVYNICMLNKSGNNRWYVANKIFTDNFIVASLIEFSIMITALVDGLVVSRLLAPGSMASFGLARPYFSIIAIFFGFMTTGMQTLCSEKIGRGDAKNFNRIFFSAFYISGIISIGQISLAPQRCEHSHHRGHRCAIHRILRARDPKHELRAGE